MSDITKEEFERGYAERSKLTVEQLHKLGRYAVPCDCDYPKCQGWQMATIVMEDKGIYRDGLDE